MTYRAFICRDCGRVATLPWETAHCGHAGTLYATHADVGTSEMWLLESVIRQAFEEEESNPSLDAEDMILSAITVREP